MVCSRMRSSSGLPLRPRPRTAVAEAPHPRLARLFAEARWIVGALCAAALLAMLLSYSREDPGFTHAAATGTLHNAGGRVGAWVADISLLLFGVSAYLIACAMLITPGLCEWSSF